MAGEANNKNNLTAAQKFLALFPSNANSFVVRRSVATEPDADGKRPGEYITYSVDSQKPHLRKKLTAAYIDRHLAGKSGSCLVLKPQLPDGTCLWAAIDFDVYQDRNEILRIMAAAEHDKFPLTFDESKSGGLHGIAFFSAPTTVAHAQMQMKLYASQLGHPDSEIFPKTVASGKKPFGIAVPFFGQPERFRAFTPTLIDLTNGDAPHDLENGEPSYLRHPGAPRGGENVEPSDLLQPGVPLPAGIDFGALLTERGLKFAKREEPDGTSYDYHKLNRQPCLIQGSVHAAQAGNVRQSRFVVRDGRVFHQCFDSDCRGETGSKTRTALAKLGITLHASPEEMPHDNNKRG